MWYISMDVPNWILKLNPKHKKEPGNRTMYIPLSSGKEESLLFSFCRAASICSSVSPLSSRPKSPNSPRSRWRPCLPFVILRSKVSSSFCNFDNFAAVFSISESRSGSPDSISLFRKNLNRIASNCPESIDERSLGEEGVAR